MDQYEQMSLLTRGPLSSISLVRHHDNNNQQGKENLCLKRIHNFDKNSISPSNFLDRVKRVQKYQHSNLVPIYDIFIDQENDDLCIVSPYLQRNLYSLAAPLSSNAVLYTAIQIADALDYLHNNMEQQIHGNLKPENIFLQFQIEDSEKQLCPRRSPSSTFGFGNNSSSSNARSPTENLSYSTSSSSLVGFGNNSASPQQTNARSPAVTFSFGKTSSISTSTHGNLLTTSNSFFSDDYYHLYKIVISDYYHSCIRNNHLLHRTYAAPELLSEEKPSTANDIWSYGAILFYLLTRIEIGYLSTTRNELIKGVWSLEKYIKSLTKEVQTLWVMVPEDFRLFISRCLELKPNDRPTISEILHHPLIIEAKQLCNEQQMLKQVISVELEKEKEVVRKQNKVLEAELRQVKQELETKTKELAMVLAMNQLSLPSSPNRQSSSSASSPNPSAPVSPSRTSSGSKHLSIYILRLQDNCFYVGKSEKPEERIKQHKQGMGCAFTRLHPVVSVEMIVTNASPFEEDRYVKEYMGKYGIENVRGGAYVSLDLEDEQYKILQKEIWYAENRCGRCGRSSHWISNCKFYVTDVNGKRLDQDNLWQCDYCGMEFGARNDYKQHILICTEFGKEFHCIRCGWDSHNVFHCVATTTKDGQTIKVWGQESGYGKKKEVLDDDDDV